MSAHARDAIIVCGTGAVSPAGWGVKPLLDAVATGCPLPVKTIARPGSAETLRVRQVPPFTTRPPWLAHARLRRTSPITQYTVAAALEALGADASLVTEGSIHLGIIVCVMSGCVNYSRRFYDETLRDPATASPLVFPETVFNAPGSHIAALLGSPGINYTLVGDPGTFAQGLALGADWLERGTVEACLIVGAEEIDWLTSHAFRLFHRNIVLSDGAGAVYLRKGTVREKMARLSAVSDSHLFLQARNRSEAVQRMQQEISPSRSASLLVDGIQDLPRYDRDEAKAWEGWTAERLSPKRILGEGLMAAAAWQSVLAIHAVEGGLPSALVSIVGTNQQAIGVAFQSNHQ